MGIDDNSDSGFPSGSGTLLNCLSSGMHTTSQSEKAVGTRMSSMSMCKSSNGGDLPFGSGWDPVFSLSQNVEFKGSLMASHGQIGNSLYTVGALENQGATSTSHLVQYPSDPCFVEMVPKLPSFGCGSFTEMVGSIGVEDGLISSSGFPPNCPSNKEDSTEKTTNPKRSTDHYAHFHEDHQISNERTIRTSPNGKKRKRMPGHSQLDPIEAGLEQREEVSGEIPEVPNEQDDKKQRTEQSHGGHSRGKLAGKQYKDSSQNGEAANDEFIHVRARRGQATNSHSLAERVRREKISQRMRFLQDLVPGCNKITGKAVMLDEIINYVQSLQRQVEFLSMKLATVNPELNIDIERILSKDILYSQGGPSAILGFGPGVSTSHPHPYVTPRGALPAIQSTNPQFPPMPQTTNVWDDELQNVIQMGLISDLAPNNLGSDACTKVEL